jgi:hypothetical protein
MTIQTLYFSTGIEMEWVGDVPTLEGDEDSMFDMCSFVWPEDCVVRLRCLVHRLQRHFPPRPMFLANTSGTEKLIAHLRTQVDMQDAMGAQYFLASVVLHQLVYAPTLSMNFVWMPDALAKS